MAERHVREFEARVAWQAALVAGMERDNHPEAAERGWAVLATLRKSFELARGHLDMERRARGV